MTPNLPPPQERYASDTSETFEARVALDGVAAATADNTDPAPNACLSPNIDAGEYAGRSTQRRINVAVSPAELRAIENIMDREGVNLTEAVRRLITYGSAIYDAIRRDNSTAHIERRDSSSREIILL